MLLELSPSQDLTSQARISRDDIESMERVMRDLPQVEMPLAHGFGPGFYARSLGIPADTFVTGKVHATEHIFMVTQGDISIYTDEGVVRVQAPYQTIGRPGTKRAVYAHADTICVNIHITTETDLEKLEAELIATTALPAPARTKEIS